MYRYWSEEEKNFIRANAALLKDAEIAASLTRLTGHPVTLYSVRQTRLRMGIRKEHGRGRCKVVPPRVEPAGMGLVISGENQ